MTTTATLESKPSVDGLAPTLGPQVCRWIEKNLVHGEGDYYGRPFRLRPWQRRFIWRAYELCDSGSRRYSRVLLGLPKGNGKTELAAAIGCAELAGPVICGGWKDGRPIGDRRVSPSIPVGAASFEQADLLFGASRTMIKEGPLADFFEVYDTEILVKNGPGRMYRVAAAAGTNDGARPTFFLADELHEWIGNKERVHLVLSNGRAKRADSWELNISTAGWDMQSLLGKMYTHGKHVRDGEETDDGFLFVWHEPSSEVDLSDAAALADAIRESNPAADDFLPTDAVVARSREIPEFEFRRYHLNQWVDTPERWLPLGCWESCADTARGLPPDGTEIVLGFDGSYSGDSTAIVGATLEEKPHLFVVGAWEKGRDPEWRVDIPDVKQSLRNACARWSVRRLGCDPYRWQALMGELLEEGLPIVAWPSHLAAHMVPACAAFYEAAVNRRVTHDGDERLTTHISHAVVKTDSRGPRIAKDHKDSARHIDLAVAGVIAHDCVVRLRGSGSWELATFTLEN
jgi:phage terminase large subunit-like protein